MNKKFILLASVIVLSFGAINEARAEIIASGNDCAANDEISTCQWEVDSEGKLTITGSGNMKSWGTHGNGAGGRSNNTPWKDMNILSVSVSGMNNIGGGAFFQLPSIKNVDISNSVKSIDIQAFNAYNDENAAILERLIIPDSVNNIGSSAFDHTTILSLIASPVSLPTILEHINKSSKQNLQIICMGNLAECQQVANNKVIKPVIAANESLCVSSNYYWSGKSCNNKNDGIICTERFKRIEDFCNRVRYTPAEAAAVANDDNTNVVTITFKKQ